MSAWNPVSGIYEAKDGRWLQLHCYFPHHLEETVKLLGVTAERPSVAFAIHRWDGLELEDAVTDADSICRVVRTLE